MIDQRPASAAVTLLAALALAVLGCAGSERGAGPSAGTTAAPRTAPPATPTTPTIEPSAETTGAAGSATGTEPSPAAEPTLEPPPVATLVAGDVRGAGEPGGWAWAGGSNAAPWLPASALDPVRMPGGALTVELAGDVGIDAWTARAATAGDTAGLQPVPLGEGEGPADAVPRFDAPPAGAWVVAVHIVFAEGLGSASYYWHVVIE